MELEPGKTFRYGKVKLRVEESESRNCCKCFFFDEKKKCIGPDSEITGLCTRVLRKDRRDVVFVVDNLPENQSTASQKKPAKNDRKDHKLRWELLPMAEIEDLVKVYTFGALKYAPDTWQSLPDGISRYGAAMLRHLCEFRKGNPLDSETHLPHLAHLAWNAVAILYLWKKENPELTKESEEDFKKLIETIDQKEETNE